MRDLSLHMLDIARNSVEAGASRLQLTIEEDTKGDVLRFSLSDNGRGMDAETLRRVTDPFYTTRTTRRQGLGLSLLRATCERCGGALKITSTLGEGTTVCGTMRLSHVDRPPLGNMGAVIQALAADPALVSVQYCHRRNGKEFHLDTADVMCNLERTDFTDPHTLLWLERRVNEGLAGLG